MEISLGNLETRTIFLAKIWRSDSFAIVKQLTTFVTYVTASTHTVDLENVASLTIRLLREGVEDFKIKKKILHY